MTEVDNTNLFIGNFSWNLNEQDLRDLFEPYWELESVKLIIDKFTQRSKGFGFVKFVNEEDAAKALKELNDKEVDGREMKVSIARPPREDYWNRDQ